MPRYLNIGGLIAAGFDESGKYLLTISHSGRGVFAVGTWERLARDSEPAYPSGGRVAGIGPINGQLIQVVEKNFQTDELRLTAPDGAFSLIYQSGVVEISEA